MQGKCDNISYADEAVRDLISFSSDNQHETSALQYLLNFQSEKCALFKYPRSK